MAPVIEAGVVSFNENVACDPRAPLSEAKQSWTRRELYKFGLREFTNVKTVWIEQ